MSAIRSYVRDLAYRHVGGSVLVLVYHRVAALPADPQLLAVHPSRFAAQMSALAERYTVLSLAELTDGLRRGRLPRRAVAITFDDGYADNLHEAAPVLARHDLPATVFVSSGYMDGQREYWWDELERLLLLPGVLPPRLSVKAAGATFDTDVHGEHEYSPEDAADHRDWNITLPPPTERQRIYLEFSRFVRTFDPVAREAALAALRELIGASDSARSSHLPLTATEVRSLGSMSGMDIGGHTANHAHLASLSAIEQRDEIVQDRERLAELLGSAPRSFAYPYGGFNDYNDESVVTAREAGYELACINFARAVKPWSDAYRVPRFLVRDWDGPELCRRLDVWFGGPGAYEGARS